MLVAIASLTLLGVTLGWLLGLAARYLKVEGNPLVEQVEALLPGSQCGQCGLPGCGAAAQALAEGRAPLTLCPAVDRALAEELAQLLGASADLSAVADQTPVIAHIHEQLCVGCTRCFKRCPTDAILGGPKMIHAVFADACIGCQKCFEVCPTEGIEMRPIEATLQTWYWPQPALAG
ncbi:RnfABCDGE type electron transport complex subunit B [Candidatus Thiosymbion oneisti]|uniref:RnfABCDGE type electron transport complex subunit B n=1 Tax=Candidatus Thiosymbion oneisti TaxID=589554 RepID=UPI000A9366D1|nr:RnfABCDGE type electron transport complex subunit B [Candidatus Thiosymbion oneisti]